MNSLRSIAKMFGDYYQEKCGLSDLNEIEHDYMDGTYGDAIVR